MKKILSLIMIFLLVASVSIMPTEAATPLTSRKPGLTVESTGYRSVKISWKRVTGAKGYQVYRKTSKSGKWKKLKTTTSLSFTNKKLTTGKRYYYRIRAYKGKTYSKYSTAKSAIPTLSKPSLTVKKSTYSKVKLSWGKVTGATGYTVYRKLKGGSWKKLGTTTKAYYTAGSLKLDKTYYFRIKARRKQSKKYYYSQYSSQKSYKNILSAPKITDSYVGDDNAVIYWDGVSGATSYKVYYKKSGGSYRYAGSTKSTNYSVWGLTGGTIYYFKVYALRGSSKSVASTACKLKTTGGISNPYGVDFKGATFTMATNDHPMFKTTYEDFDKKISGFQEAYNCQIVIDDIPWGEFNDRVKRDSDDGMPHDIVLLHGSMLHDGAARGIYQDLTSYIKSGDYSSSGKKGGLDAAKIPYLTLKGKTYAAANHYSCYPYVIFYNKSILADNGFSGARDPQTLAKNGQWSWDDIKSMAEVLHKPSANRYMLSNSFSTRVMALSYGAPVVKRESNGAYVENISSAEFRNSLEFVRSLFSGSDAIGESVDNGQHNRYKTFLSGNAVMYTEESYKMLQLCEDILTANGLGRNAANIGVVEFPLPAGGKYPTSWLTGIASANGGNPQAAIEWAKYCSNFIDSNNFSASDASYVATLYDRELCFEVGQFQGDQGDALGLSSSPVNAAARGQDYEGIITSNKDKITNAITQTMNQLG